MGWGDPVLACAVSRWLARQELPERNATRPSVANSNCLHEAICGLCGVFARIPRHVLLRANRYVRTLGE